MLHVCADLCSLWLISFIADFPLMLVLGVNSLIYASKQPSLAYLLYLPSLHISVTSFMPVYLLPFPPPVLTLHHLALPQILPLPLSLSLYG